MYEYLPEASLHHQLGVIFLQTCLPTGKGHKGHNFIETLHVVKLFLLSPLIDIC